MKLHLLTGLSIGPFAPRRSAYRAVLSDHENKRFVILVLREKPQQADGGLGQALQQCLDRLWDTSKENPFAWGEESPDHKVVALELDWASIVGIDYRCPLHDDGRLTLEARQVVKRCFKTVEDARDFYSPLPALATSSRRAAFSAAPTPSKVSLEGRPWLGPGAGGGGGSTAAAAAAPHQHWSGVAGQRHTHSPRERPRPRSTSTSSAFSAAAGACGASNLGPDSAGWRALRRSAAGPTGASTGRWREGLLREDAAPSGHARSVSASRMSRPSSQSDQRSRATEPGASSPYTAAAAAGTGGGCLSADEAPSSSRQRSAFSGAAAAAASAAAAALNAAAAAAAGGADGLRSLAARRRLNLNVELPSWASGGATDEVVLSGSHLDTGLARDVLGAPAGGGGGGGGGGGSVQRKPMSRLEMTRLKHNEASSPRRVRSVDNLAAMDDQSQHQHQHQHQQEPRHGQGHVHLQVQARTRSGKAVADSSDGPGSAGAASRGTASLRQRPASTTALQPNARGRNSSRLLLGEAPGERGSDRSHGPLSGVWPARACSGDLDAEAAPYNARLAAARQAAYRRSCDAEALAAARAHVRQPQHGGASSTRSVHYHRSPPGWGTSWEDLIRMAAAEGSNGDPGSARSVGSGGRAAAGGTASAGDAGPAASAFAAAAAVAAAEDVPRASRWTVPSGTYRACTLMLSFRDPFLPQVLRRFVKSDIRLLKLYESGLPPWAMLMPCYGLPYRPWMRRAAWLAFLAISVVSMAAGFYDLWRNVPFLKQVVTAIASRLYLPAAEFWDRLSDWLERHTQLRMSILLTYLFSKSPLLVSFMRALRSLAALLQQLLAPALAALGAALAPVASLVQAAAAGLGGGVAAAAGAVWQATAPVVQAVAAYGSEAGAFAGMVLGPPARAVWGLAVLVAQLVRLVAALLGMVLVGPVQLACTVAGALSWVGGELAEQVAAAWQGMAWALQWTVTLGRAAQRVAPAVQAGARAAASAAQAAGAAGGAAGGAAMGSLTSGVAVWQWLGLEVVGAYNAVRLTFVQALKSAQAVINFLCTVACVTVQHRVSLLLQLRRFLTRQKGRLPAAVAASVPLPSFVSMPSFDGASSLLGGPPGHSSYSLTLSASGQLASLMSGHSNSGGGASGHLPSVFSRGLSGVLEAGAEAEADESSISSAGGASPGGRYNYRYAAAAAAVAAAAAAGGDISEADSGDMRTLMVAALQREEAEERGEAAAMDLRAAAGGGSVSYGGALFRAAGAAGLRRRRHVGAEGSGHGGSHQPPLQRQLSAVDESEHEGLSGPQGPWAWGSGGGPGHGYASGRRHTADEAAGNWQRPANCDALRGSGQGSWQREEAGEEDEEHAPGYWHAAAEALSASLTGTERRSQRGHHTVAAASVQGRGQEQQQGKKRRQPKHSHARHVDWDPSVEQAAGDSGSGGGVGGQAGVGPLGRVEPASHMSGSVPGVPGAFTVFGGVPAPAPEDIPLARQMRSSSAPLVARPHGAGLHPAQAPESAAGHEDAKAINKQQAKGWAAASSARADGPCTTGGRDGAGVFIQQQQQCASGDGAGTVAAAFVARLPHPGDGGKVHLRVVPNAPEGRLKLAYRVLANALHAYLDLGESGAGAAHQLAEAGAGAAKWRTVRLPLRERNVVGQLQGPEVAHILLDYVVLTLPSSVARLPELELLPPLARQLHSYAHGGFMGAALSLLAEPRWATILSESMGEGGDDKVESVIRELTGLQRDGVTAARRELLPLMLVLENSPVLCAYGLVRMGLVRPPREVLDAAAAADAAAGPDGCMPAGPYLWQSWGLAPAKVPYMLRPFLAGGRGPGLNRYGYMPMRLEWDLWLNPDDASDLAGAVVDHGTPGALVQQAIAMTLGCKGVAKAMGRAHNRQHGISPLRWLADFATALNAGANGKHDQPLPLFSHPHHARRHGHLPQHTQYPQHAGSVDAETAAQYTAHTDGATCPSVEKYLQLSVAGLKVRLPPAAAGAATLPLAERLAVRLRVVGNTHSHSPAELTKFAEAGGSAGAATATAGSAPAATDGTHGGGASASGWRTLLCTQDLTGQHKAAEGGGGGGGKSSLYPLEARDMGTTLLVVEVVPAKGRSRTLARSIIPLMSLSGRPEGSVTLCAQLRVRRAAPDAAAAGAGTGAENKATTPELAPSTPTLGNAARPVAEAMEMLVERGCQGGNSQASGHTAVTIMPAGPVAEAAEGEGEGDGRKQQSQQDQQQQAGEPTASPPKEQSMARGAEAGAKGTGGARGAWARTVMAMEQVRTAAQQATATRSAASETAGAADTDRPKSVGAPAPPAFKASTSIRLADIVERARDQAAGLHTRSGPGGTGDSDGEESGLGAVPESEAESDFEEEGWEEGEGGALPQQLLLEGMVSGAALGADDVFVATDPAAAESQLAQLCATAHRCAVSVSLRWETLTTLQAAEQLYGLPAHVAQSCTAMLSSPGGLFLDIKSGYSTAPQLRAFASTLAGIGIYTKAICSFVPRQIEYEDPPPPASAAETGLSRGQGSNAAAGNGIGSSTRHPQSTLTSAQSAGDTPAGNSPATTSSPTAAAAAAAAAGGGVGAASDAGAAALPAKPAAGFASKKQLPGPLPRFFDTVLFFHGLNGLELACEAGRVAPGTCVLFNGASMLVEDPGAAVAVPDAARVRQQVGKLVEQAVEAEERTRDKEEEGAEGAGPSKVKSRSGKSNVPTEAEVQAAMSRAGISVKEQMRQRHGCLPSCLGAPAKGGRPPPHKVVDFTPVVDAAEAEAKREAIELAVVADAEDKPGSRSGGGGGDMGLPELVDREAWRRYCTVVSMFKVYGGIYVQEPDCSPSCVDALVRLTNAHPDFLPLGFAYGHISTKAVAAAGHVGRGMAAQQLMEELQSRKKLSDRVSRWIDDGVHVGASDQVYLSWARRLLTSEELLYLRSQRLLLRLLADYDCGGGGPLAEGPQMLSLLDGMGTMRFIMLRFFRHYEATSPLTLFEVGFNMNHTKAFLRLCRNRGALAALSPAEKMATALWLVRNRQLWVWLHRCGRRDVHKLVKEAMACLVESCSLKEYGLIVDTLGGEGPFRREFVGWIWLGGWSYMRRIKACKEHWASSPGTPLLSQPSQLYGYVKCARRLPGGGLALGQGIDAEEYEGTKKRLPRFWLHEDVVVTMDPTHTRYKVWWMKLWRFVRKCGCCVGTCFWNTAVFEMCFCYALCLCPMLCYPYCRSRVLPLLLALVLIVVWFLIAAAVGGAVGASKGPVKRDEAAVEDVEKVVRRLLLF
ncbi:hypothetical protein HYH02_001941 [Chlamydomonas schloesseri]|uniref:Uncharacterized protein n=1 Tax=Chlamydomonas schloesseri TaxID=2026947 RepID=A0A835WU18_9CHLO|nr:hypothetical protein HYH02_001941 [Chlamydomonas schloesseri]|eukprot:KAG2453730.1 hypothetical protein HYH02_001941 [Chlamydomonas schloesseri]